MFLGLAGTGPGSISAAPMNAGEYGSTTSAPVPKTASAARWIGRAVPMTPFDLKLMAGGFYTVAGADSAVSDEHPGETLGQIFARSMTFGYKKDAGQDFWQDPDVTEKTGIGDCEDLALWLYRELRKNGYRNVRIMVGKFEASEDRHHTWITLPGVGGDDLIVDPALQTRIWKRSDLLQNVYVPLYSFDGVRKYEHSFINANA